MLPTLRLASRQPGPWGGNGPPTPEEAARHSLSSANELRCRQLLEATTARYRHREATAAVLVPLCLVHGDPSLLYTLRSSRLVGRHKGDVSFPGGKCDPQDQDIVDTALRETREELGLSIQEENVWGVMKPVDDGVSTSLPGLQGPPGSAAASVSPGPRAEPLKDLPLSFTVSLAALPAWTWAQESQSSGTVGSWPSHFLYGRLPQFPFLEDGFQGPFLRQTWDSPCSAYRKTPSWSRSSPRWGPWSLWTSRLTPRRWMTFSRCRWPTCCTRGTRATPTSAVRAATATPCPSSCTALTVSGGSRPSSRSSCWRCWCQGLTGAESILPGSRGKERPGPRGREVQPEPLTAAQKGRWELGLFLFCLCTRREGTAPAGKSNTGGGPLAFQGRHKPAFHRNHVPAQK
uniref:Nudix hydrolase 8 n=1 Tax=Sarcophilus harrisii TaxID=9305 RepID=A0A7N4NWY5_SARHA